MTPEQVLKRVWPFFVSIYFLWRLSLKGTVAWDFLSKVTSPKVSNWSSDSWTKQFRIYIWIRWETRLLRSFCAMGHCGKFFYALWATTVNLIVRYGPLRRVWFGGFGSTPWALRRIWLCAMGHYAEWSHTVKKSVLISALWTIAQDLAIRYGP
jgi:hypothetical protein